MLLADSAQVADGKLYILGGGWSVTGPDPTPSAVAMKVSVDAHEFNTNHHWELFLEDTDGQPVRFDTPEGSQTIEVRGDFSAPSPDGVPAGVQALREAWQAAAAGVDLQAYAVGRPALQRALGFWS